MAPVGATASTESSDQQQVSTEGFQLICDLTSQFTPLKAMDSCTSHTHDFLDQNFGKKVRLVQESLRYSSAYWGPIRSQALLLRWLKKLSFFV